MRSFGSLSVAASWLLLFSCAAEAEFVRPASATASSRWSANTGESHLIQLRGTAGDKTLSAESPTATHPEDGGGPEFGQWHTADGDMTNGAWVVFDFGFPRILTHIYIWQANQTGLFDRGVDGFSVDVSTNQTAWHEALAPTNLAISSGGDIAAESFGLSNADRIRYARINITSTHGSTYAGLSEVRFEAVANEFLGGDFNADTNWVVDCPSNGVSGYVGTDGTMSWQEHNNWAAVTITNGTISRTGHFRSQHTTWNILGGTLDISGYLHWRAGVALTVDGGTVNVGLDTQLESSPSFLSGTITSGDYLYFRRALSINIRDAVLELDDLRFWNNPANHPEANGAAVNFYSGGDGSLTLPGDRVSFLTSLVEGSHDPSDPRRAPDRYGGQGGVALDFDGGPYPVNIKLDGDAVSIDAFSISYDSASNKTTICVAPPDLVGHWGFDSDGEDTSGYGNDAVIKGTAAVTHTGGEHVIGGGALSVPGSKANYAFVSDDGLYDGNLPAVLRLPNRFTVAAWAWRDSADDNQSWILSNRYWQDGYALGRTASTPSGTNAYVLGRYQSIGQPGLQLADPQPVDENWFFIAGTFSRSTPGDNQALYINGELRNASRRTSAYGINNGIPLGIGIEHVELTSGDGRNAWDGDIDDVSIWNGPLSAGEVRALYNLATDAVLNYDASRVHALFELYADGAGGGTVTFGNYRWRYADGLTATRDGQLNAPPAVSRYEVVLDASKGTGLVAAPRGTVLLVR